MPIDLFNDPIESLRNTHRAGFSRMFPWLPPHQFGGPDPKAAQQKLAKLLYDKDASPGTDANQNPRLPAGYAFFAQLVAHDLSFDPSNPGQVGPEDGSPSNTRTPRLDLDVLYGGDPDQNLDYYELDPSGQNTYRFRFGGDAGEKQFDVPRDRNLAQIPDQRDDEHVIISQLHVALMRLHNENLKRIVALKQVPADQQRVATRADFFEAQRRTRWYYQYVVVEDLLPRLLGERQCRSLLEPCRTHWLERQASMSDAPSRKASVPLEFTVAIYRIGHSAIRANYTINNEAGPLPLFAAPPAQGSDDLTGLMGRQPLDHRLVVSWERMLRVPGCESRVEYSRRFGPRLPLMFSQIPGLEKDGGLSGRDLERSRALGLPSGQDVARRLGLPANQIEIGNDPLWYYAMKEVADGGLCVGPVAARILCKVFMDVLHLDSGSYLAQQPDWSPGGVVDPANALLHLVQAARMPIGPPDDAG